MSSARLRERVPQADSVGRGRLLDWCFACNKTGSDGSAKANIVRRPGAVVWGAVYLLPTLEFLRLDRFEGGYRRISVEVELDTGALVRCATYTSEHVSDDLVPLDWYRRHILLGAAEHGLPIEHVALLEALPQVAKGR